MLRSILSVIAGNVAWTILWLGMNVVLASMNPQVADGKTRIESFSILTFLLVYSVVISVAAGYITALVARRNEIAHTFALGILQLALGIFFQYQAWNLSPMWYHLSFLILLIPGDIFGGIMRLKQSRKEFA